MIGDIIEQIVNIDIVHIIYSNIIVIIILIADRSYFSSARVECIEPVSTNYIPLFGAHSEAVIVVVVVRIAINAIIRAIDSYGVDVSIVTQVIEITDNYSGRMDCT